MTVPKLDSEQRLNNILTGLAHNPKFTQAMDNGETNLGRFISYKNKGFIKRNFIIVGYDGKDDFDGAISDNIHKIYAERRKIGNQEIEEYIQLGRPPVEGE